MPLTQRQINGALGGYKAARSMTDEERSARARKASRANLEKNGLSQPRQAALARWAKRKRAAANDAPSKGDE